ncbi:MAG: formate dehydrogenase subunit gamma [Desulforhopalus sp.]
MNRILLTIILLFVTGSADLVAAGSDQVLADFSTGSSADYYHSLISIISGNWQEYGQLFTTLQGQWFWKAFLVVITAVPGVFLLHYLIIGPKHFDHAGEQILFFPLPVRVVHFIVALSFSLLVLTGLMIVFGGYLGGGTPIRLARYVHLVSAMVVVLPVMVMFVMWLKNMLPQFHDIAWIFIFGGYLSKKKKPVPAGKFNAGQKMYFWFATSGGGVMAYTGYIIWEMEAHIDTVRLYAIIHNVLGMGLVAFYLTHLYMSVFAIAGSLESIRTGYKSKDEVDILHSRYKY